MANQRFVENPWHDKKKSRARVPDDLWTAKRVLVRADKGQPSLAPKDTGPYRVLHRWRKCFRVQLDNKTDTVSLDRLGPLLAYLARDLFRPQYTVCVMVITGGQSSNKVEPSSVIVMLLSVYTHLTILFNTLQITDV